MAAYLYSIEVNSKSEERIREQFVSDLKRNDKTIDDLRMKLDMLELEKKSAQTVATEAMKAKEAAEKTAEAAEKALDEAVRSATASLKERIDTLLEELRISRSETDAARRDAETAAVTARAELSKAHHDELSELRRKLDERTDDLLQAKQQISDLQQALQNTRS